MKNSVYLIVLIYFFITACGGTKKESAYTIVSPGIYDWMSIAKINSEDGSAPKYGVLANDSEVYVPFEYDAIHHFTIADIISSHSFYAAEKDGVYDIYTYDGKPLISGVSDYEIPSSDPIGAYCPSHVVFTKDNKKYALFRENSTKVFGPYDRIVATNGKVAFFMKNGKWGAFKFAPHKTLGTLEKATDCNEFIAAEYDKLYSTGNKGVKYYSYYFGLKDGKWVTIDDAGEVCQDKYTVVKPASIPNMKLDDFKGYNTTGKRTGTAEVGFFYFNQPYGVGANAQDVYTWKAMEVRLGDMANY